ncbi:MAG: S-formylglutathione hydrolase [Psychrosphaera sp.]|nr:S-formylglutathione hydrolase [Psychrosphaera sp.]
MNQLTQVSQTRCCDGWIKTFSHQSTVNNCQMRFAVYLPPQADTDDNLPVLYWLSGLTCTEENFMAKSGAQRYAAEHGIIIVAPDTSPRGDDVPDDVDGAWDFGLGAGFYVNATKAPWDQHYHMYDYVVKELPALVNQHFGVDAQRKSISGHSMGGHGALMIALRNPGEYQSVSAFAPIVAPISCPWGQKALGNYLGSDTDLWQAYDSCYLIENPVEPDADKLTLLISQGKNDNFLKEQLQPQLIEKSCEKAGHPLQLNLHEGYDHSYYFIASFIGEHMAFHAKALSQR